MRGRSRLGGEQDQAEHGVHGEDVAREQQDRVQGAEHEQARQAPQEARGEAGTAPLRGVELEREAVAEEEREQQEELGLEEHRDEPSDRPVEGRGEAGVLQARAVIGRRHVADVDDEDAQQGEAAQGVDLREPPACAWTCASARTRVCMGMRLSGRRVPVPPLVDS